MGRAFEVRKASIMKNGAARGKIYSMYAREIYQAAKNGGTNLESNYILRRLVDKAKTEQVPSDIIKRAIDKVNSGADETYQQARYELFGPAGSTLIVDCLTDNVNRTVSSLRAVVNKAHAKMGAMGSVSYQYEHLCIVGFKGMTDEEAMDVMIEAGIDITDIEYEDGIVTIYGDPKDLYDIKNAVTAKLGEIEFVTDEIAMLPKETITLAGEDLETFKRIIALLDDVEDVQHVYHNVDL